MSVAEVGKMSTLERIHAMEELWDALSHEKHEIDSPPWHETILQKRKERIKSGKTKFISLEQLKQRYSK